MRLLSLALGCLCLGACNLVFDATNDGKRRDAATDDAATADAPDPTQLSVALAPASPAPIFARSGNVDLSLTTTGNRAVHFQITTDAGFFPDSMQPVFTATAEAGAQTTTVRWRTPTAWTLAHFTVRASHDPDLTDPLEITRDLEVFEHGGRFLLAQPTDAISVEGGRMVALPFLVTAPIPNLRGLGVQVVGQAGANQLKLALYRSDGNIPSGPGALVAATAGLPIPVNGGFVETTVDGGPLLPGTYWITVLPAEEIKVIGKVTNEVPPMRGRRLTEPTNFRSGPPPAFGEHITVNGTLGAYAILGPTPPDP
jgi:hypothetical protein